ncbi:MAG: FAD-binding oxidoreductase [Paracoccaceae bacterium]
MSAPLRPADDAVVARLRARLPERAFRAAEDRHLTEPRGRWTGRGVLISPADTDEVAMVLAEAARARVAVVPIGGGTGLVGGQLMAEGAAPIILSLERLDRIGDPDPVENAMTVGAGAILSDIRAAAARVDRLFPLSLASEGSARIGGLLATNAGGTNVLRYGNARAQCLGVEVVTADGRVWSNLSSLRKDNAGYDLRDLFVGSEGTLGVITAATLRLSPVPAGVGVAWLAVPSPRAALSLLARLQGRVGEAVTAFELLGRQGPDFVRETGLEATMPLDPMPDWSVLVEVGLPRGLDPAEVLAAAFEDAHAAGLATDGVIASSQAQAAALWQLREVIPEANRRIGAISSHDVSVPLSAIPDFIDAAGAALASSGDYRVNCFGHAGDGNLHYNVFPRPGRSRTDHADERAAIKRCVHDLVHAAGGSVAAEHGVGRLKVDDLERYGDPVKLALMRSVKDALDPAGILNPGAVLRAR